jgi:NTE family protein
MRASLSIPGAFTPVEIGGRLLVDGGLVENLPVGVAKAMGADVIIAVDIGSQYIEAENLGSILEFSDQVFRIMTRGNTQRSLAGIESGDVLITPELGDMSAADFGGTPAAVRLGEEGAREAASDLRRFSVSEAAFTGFLASQRRSGWEPAVIDAIPLENDSRVSEDIIRRRMKQQVGETFDPDTVEEDISRVFGLGEFERVSYQLERADGGSELKVRLKGKSWGPNYIRFGLTLADDSEGNSIYNLLDSHTKTQVNRLGAEWKNEVQIGNNFRVATEFYQPLAYSGLLFVSAQAAWDEVFSFEYFGGSASKYRIRTVRGEVAGGIQFGKFGQLKAGLIRASARIEPRIGPTSLPDYKVQEGALFVGLKIDRIDSMNFPRHGGSVDALITSTRDYLGTDRVYDKFEVGTMRADTFKKNTLLSFLRLGTSFDTDLPDYADFELGGFLNLSGYSRGELAGRHGAALLLVFYRQVAGLPNSALGNAVYLGGSLEMGNVWQNRSDARLDDMKYSGTILAGFDTMLGPLYLAYGWGESGRRTYYFYLGRTF